MYNEIMIKRFSRAQMCNMSGSVEGLSLKIRVSTFRMEIVARFLAVSVASDVCWCFRI
jgi:hypothetical protein